METPVYSEKQVMKFRWLIVILGIAIMLIGAYESRNTEPFGAFVMVLFSALFAVVLWGFTTLNIVITPTELRFGFPLYRKRFSLSKLEVGDIEKIALIAGIGIHYWSGRWVYNAHYGRGVNLKHGRFRYLLGSNQPEQLHNMLLQLAPRGPLQP